MANPPMHGPEAPRHEVVSQIVEYALDRIRLDPVPLDHPRTEADLRDACGPTITTQGLGGEAALRLFTEVLAPASISVDHPHFLSFVPAAPTEASVLFDLVVGASSIYGGSWLEGAGPIFAENEALDWIRRLAGLPDTAGGVFVSGGTTGNLSAMVAAREAARLADPSVDRWAFIASAESHSSVASACRVMDADLVLVPTSDDRRLTGAAVAEALNHHGPGVCAVVATSGTTNLGVIDDLESIGEVCRSRGVWFHVDGAYGGAGLASSRLRPLFAGIELADSFIVDPHKWLFAPFDCCALLYRDPEVAVQAHAQHAGYLDFLDTYGGWNPSDYAIHLTRRVRGLPFWYSLATHGTAAYERAIDSTLDRAGSAAVMIERAEHLELVAPPSLSIVAFRRIGWEQADYEAWTTEALRSGLAFVTPTVLDGETVFRLCFVNPLTTDEGVAQILASMGSDSLA